MGEIARVNNIDVWWEDFGERSNTTILLIMGANANALYWDQKFIDELVKNNYHVVIFDNRDVGKSMVQQRTSLGQTGQIRTCIGIEKTRLLCLQKPRKW